MTDSNAHTAVNESSGLTTTNLVRKFYSETDGHASRATFVSWLADNCLYSLNTNEIVGASNTADFVLERRAQYRSVRHSIEHVVADDAQGAAGVEMSVEYELTTGEVVVIHGSAFLTFVDERVTRFQVYVDPQPLIAATQ